jgi:hypothetical protein
LCVRVLLSSNEPAFHFSGVETGSMHQHEPSHLWAVFLAGGDGVWLRKLTRKIAGDSRPKQFCNLLGPSSLMAETLRERRSDHSPRTTTVRCSRNRGGNRSLGILETLQADPDAVVRSSHAITITLMRARSVLRFGLRRTWLCASRRQ